MSAISVRRTIPVGRLDLFETIIVDGGEFVVEDTYRTFEHLFIYARDGENNRRSFLRMKDEHIEVKKRRRA